ncbi:hypothetical protein Q31b_53020 [Novipirellula aureliae]|uniref:YetF C-terminal domain-containing protein n=1 Tax=Novipirellula aureliae TaxID=2527966 RepID=A0A5C6DJW2_9BACT|nr:YetF domain-containing protein [Novipirellula aureliae]TWU35206.1 hypothetical protein Q31b_53020 [Novipirellula aureliae]
MFDKWIAISLDQLGMILISSFVVYAAILLYTRIVGLRSFSKMSAGDFAMTIAVGSLFGATISSPNPTLLMGLFAMLCVFGGQWLLAKLRRKSTVLSKLVDNQPLLLMTRSQILHGNLKRANMTEGDLFGKLREANAFHFDQVIAVILETTGDVSVIHSDRETPDISSQIFDHVIGSERLKFHKDDKTS